MENVQRVERMLETAIAAGATPLVRGGPAKDGPPTRGAFFRRALLEIAGHDLLIAQDEAFGPAPVMQAFDGGAEAIAPARNSAYPLAASVWSTNVDRPLRIARRINAGTVRINNWTVVCSETEEGGCKQSGLGRLNGMAAWTTSSSTRPSCTRST